MVHSPQNVLGARKNFNIRVISHNGDQFWNFGMSAKNGKTGIELDLWNGQGFVTSTGSYKRVSHSDYLVGNNHAMTSNVEDGLKSIKHQVIHFWWVQCWFFEGMLTYWNMVKILVNSSFKYVYRFCIQRGFRQLFLVLLDRKRSWRKKVPHTYFMHISFKKWMAISFLSLHFTLFRWVV